MIKKPKTAFFSLRENMISRLARLAGGFTLILAALSGVFGQLPFVSSTSGRSYNPLSGTSQPTGATAAGGSSTAFSTGSNYQFPHSSTGAVLPGDNSIDENSYMIGGGDVFFITSVESPSIRYTAVVDQSGKAYIQNVGLVDIGKVSYAEAKKTISGYISSRLKNPSEIYIMLVQTKTATVSFTGQVSAPGSYELSGATRLLDAIRAANDNSMPLASEADLRRIQRENGRDSVVYYDLLAYLHKGDGTQNPYVYPGDRIRVNAITDKVFISGAVKAPASGYYPIKKGETLSGLLSMFTLDNTADTGAIIVYQPSDNSKRTLSISEAGYLLNDLDAITVPVKKNSYGLYTASIMGEIASPGHYPIVENSTSARQLIDMAGGMKATGFFDQAVIIRPLRNLPDRFNSGAPQIGAVRPERGSSISAASASRDYAIIRLVLFNPEKVIIEPQDQIIIPKKDSFVYISGSVRNPGAYLFLPGKDSRYYVTQAGGYSSNADRSNVQVYLKYGDAVQSIEPRCVEPGSVIVVPASVQYKFLSQVVLPLLSTLVATVSLGLSIYVTSKQ
jgi:protein involved in polysaccharide export with SLBB domain